MARALILVLLIMGSALAWGQPEKDAAASAAYQRLFESVKKSDFLRHFESIGASPSRLAGSDGERQTLAYVEREFRRLGLKNIRKEPFEVTVPDPESIGVLRSSDGNWSISVLPLWPNLVRTSTCDVEGPMIYGRFGTLEDLKGKSLDGAIVLLEFASGANWRNAFKLGAQAVVFVEPDSMDRTDAEQKFSSTPLSAPRFYLPLRDAGPVLRAAFRTQKVRLTCRQNWVRRSTYNLLADLPARTPSKSAERLVLGAAADAMSVVPGRAPGASGASSLAALLELARQAASNPGNRPMTFVAIAANALGLQGWREYAERRLQEGKTQFLHVTLDLDQGRPTLGAFARSWYADYRNETLDPVRNLTRVLRANADRMAPLHGVESGRFVTLDAANDSDGRTWRNTIFGKFAFGCEPLMMAGMNAITLATVETSRARLDTPFDQSSIFDRESLIRQTQTLACILWHLARDTSDPGELSVHKVPVTARVPTRGTLVSAFGTLEGRVVQFDPNESFVADIPVTNALAVAGHAQKTLAGVRGAMVQAVDPKTGAYRFVGVQPSRNFWHLDQRYQYVAAYALDEVSGRITMAPTDGLFGQSTDRLFRITSSYLSFPIVVFPAVGTDLYGLVDPHELKPFEAFGVYDPKADATPRNFSIAIPAAAPRMNSDREDTAVLFMEEGAKFKLLMTSAYGEWRLILIGADRKSPTGAGYQVSRENTRLADVAGLTAHDLLTLNQSRLDTFAQYRILSPELDALQRQARDALDDAEQARQSRDWPRAERSAHQAWGYALRAHPMIMGTVNDVVNGVLFYLALLIPFSIFAERLFFAKRKLTSQLFASMAIFIGSFIVLLMIHPAFEIVSNPSMIFVAFVMGTLSLLVATFIIGKFESSLRDMRALQTGLRHIDVGRMSVAMAAFNLGIANMRRRKARTFLTTLTLIVMTFIVLSFTSIVPGLSLGESPSSNEGTYPGMLVRNPGLDPLQNLTYLAVANEFSEEATVVRRVWYYGADIADHGVLTATQGERSADVRAIAGFEPKESEVTRPQLALLPGGRWFVENDREVAILPFSVAERLRIGPEEAGKAEIGFAGRQLRVIGILDDSRLRATMDL
ncbi:MAG TPA: M28 family peptidase, partial [Fimbriimonadaceae bacterium]|nr:M28 family peptidase [Fimbriimonadaceae bacterium]